MGTVVQFRKLMDQFQEIAHFDIVDDLAGPC